MNFSFFVYKVLILRRAFLFKTPSFGLERISILWVQSRRFINKSLLVSLTRLMCLNEGVYN